MKQYLIKFKVDRIIYWTNFRQETFHQVYIMKILRIPERTRISVISRILGKKV